MKNSSIVISKADRIRAIKFQMTTWADSFGFYADRGQTGLAEASQFNYSSFRDEHAKLIAKVEK